MCLAQSFSCLASGFLRLRSCSSRSRHEALPRTDAAALFWDVSWSGLRCYKCSDYTGRCQNVQECTFEDSCISLSERGGKTIRQCIRYTDCDNSRLTQMFPAITGFTYRCCSSNLCNSGITVTTATPSLALAAALLSVFWSWM
ncbi:CD59 glycoprotein isoform X4 [Stegastes partitus]|uniref:CD59 glycoprotein isoform X4 n=1 Tax=Stegastes partitus TaxID=144197 RepID=A0A9Y4NU03_9TELE|nr:PREDICTED: CD59 glycoprotein-like isoform X4 [Stegastes partitus]